MKRKKRKLIWQIFPPFLIVVLLCIAAVTWYTSHAFKMTYIDEVSDNLIARANLVEDDISNLYSKKRYRKLKSTCKKLGEKSDTRITLILKNGKVICDSKNDLKKMDDHSNRPEIISALNGFNGVSIRYSDTMKINMMYTAIPFEINGTTVGALRTSVPLNRIKDVLKSAYLKIAGVGFIAAMLAAFSSLFITRRISRPLIKLKMGAELFAKGDLDSKLPITGSQEISALAESLNHMADQLKRLENVRRDFVANVSHELKTPITAIKGFIETLIEDGADSPEEAKRFLGITLNQVDRLNAIIDDLLSLSKIEQESNNAEIILKNALLENILSASIQSCSAKAKAKSMKIDMFCQSDLKAKVNPLLLEQAVSNLIDNSIKYSEEDRIININAHKEGDEILISVRDRGFGIPEEHLPRLFERFYCVDKARSRKYGGTGLGLAIVKHIITTHGGYITVKSEQNKGSTFIIHLINPDIHL